MLKHYVIMFVFLIVLLFILYLIYLFHKNYNKESLCIFMSKEEISKFILNDHDYYIQNMSNLDLKARGVSNYEEYLTRILYNIKDLSLSEKNKLNRCAKKADDFFIKMPYNPYIDDGKELTNIKWVFACIGDKYEEGFPHTRSKIIFISPRIISLPEFNLTKTLIHEKIHIYQRYNNLKIKHSLYLKGYTPHKNRAMEDNLRSNPDTDNIIYKTPKGTYMYGKYNTDNPKSINDIDISGDYEHPFEMIAYEIEKLYNV